MRVRFAAIALALSGCVVTAAAPKANSTNDAGPSDAGMTPVDAGGSMDAGAYAVISTANPPGGTFVGSVQITLTSNIPATISYTTDGSSPATSVTAKSGPSPVTFTLTAPIQASLVFYAHTATLYEIPHSQDYDVIDNLTAASISGELIVPASLQSGQAEVWLFTEAPSTAGSAPIAETPVSLSATGGAQYSFQGLAAGSYWVVGVWWPGAPSGNPEGVGISINSPITLNPTIQSMARADFVDVYVGQCDPTGTGVDGVVNVGSNLLADTVSVLAYSQPVGSVSNQMPLGATDAIGTGATRPFALCGQVGGDEYILAGAFVAGMSNPVAVASNGNNPVSDTPVFHETIYLGETNPAEGAIAGTITLNGPLTGGTVYAGASSTPWAMGATNPALATATMTDATHYAFNLPSLGPGTYYMIATVTDSAGQSASFPQASTITVAGTATAMTSLVASDGSITGTVSITNVPSGISNALMLATPSGSMTPVATNKVTLSTPATTGGNETATYSLFGLPDGTYTVTAIVDVSGTGNYTADLQAGADGMSTTQPVIASGNSATADLSFALP